MRFVPSAGVTEFAVDQFLQDKASLWMPPEISSPQENLKVGNVTMQITGNKNLGAILKNEGVATPSRGCSHQCECLSKMNEQTIGSRHENTWRVNCKILRLIPR
jgi:hypothetical protein